MINYQEIFHVGFLVPDLRAAMAQYSASLGVTWAQPRMLDNLRIWTPDKGVHHVRNEFTYSVEGPQHLEIQCGSPGSVYDPALHTGFHVGIWSDDLAAEVEKLLARGWKIVVSGGAPQDGYGNFTYLAPPAAGPMVEVVSSVIKPIFEKWWAGE